MGSYFTTASPSPRGTPAPSFKRIEDNYSTLSELLKAIEDVGLESCNLIIGVDFTKSNLSKGRHSYSGLSLHHIEAGFTNPYQEVIFLIGKTLSRFDDDGLIPAYVFGDIVNSNERVTPFFHDRDCNGFEEVLLRYTHLVPFLTLSGPTSFAPLIYEAISIVKQTRKYHILLIITDGEVSDERKDAAAIISASRYPLSIIVVGVGDGPWETMIEFDNELPEREFDNFQFVPFSSATMSGDAENPENTFTVAALQEIPEQYRAIKALGLLHNL